jgi:hypothetical protein
VREAFRLDDYNNQSAIYRADMPDSVAEETKGIIKWKPSIHMPRWASRLTLKITDVRVERVQDISEEDALAEGIDRTDNNFGNGVAYCDYQMKRKNDTSDWFNSPVDSFQSLWDSINNNWNDNPWVWVIQFEVIKQNVDEVMEAIK